MFELGETINDKIRYKVISATEKVRTAEGNWESQEEGVYNSLRGSQSGPCYEGDI